MGDTVTVGGVVYHTDERTIGAILAHIQRISEIGSSAFATGQVVVTTTAATLVAARDTRKRLVINNNSNQDAYVGPPTVTTANGFRVAVGSSLVLYTTALVQAIIASGTMTGDVDYIEEYDS